MSNLRIAETDFDTIKQNLKTFLQSQSEFTDYDFEGSGLAVLLDILAYNTHYNAYYANMLMNEAFLDSAVKRASAVSLAKHLGYTPRSTRSSTANIDLVVSNPPNLPPTLTLPRFTSFTSTINGSIYTFLNPEEYTTTRIGTTYTFSNVEIKEGTFQEYTFAVTDVSTDKHYPLPSTNIDTTTLVVTVQTSATDTTSYRYNLATDITSLNGESKVFYLEQNSFGRFEIFFGDGILGKQLSTGNLIKVRFIASSGTGSNVSNQFTQAFTVNGSIGGSSSIAITVNSNSTGGAEAETISEIKFNAPKIYSAKNRAVTPSDYEALLQNTVTEAESISVWGGEDNDPPKYGKILISLKPFEGFLISETTKNNILNNILKTKKVTAITPEFIDPEYLYARFDVRVTYNSTSTNLSPGAIKTLIYNGITTYFNVNLNKFNKTFYAAQLSKFLMDLNPSIISVSFESGLQRRIDPTLNIENYYTGINAIRFYNKIHPNEVRSTTFYINLGGVNTLVYMQDRSNDNPPNYEGMGTLGMYSYNTNRLITNIGSVNYGTGEVIVEAVTPIGYIAGQSGIQLTVNLQEEFYSIATTRNQLLILDTSVADTVVKRLDGINIDVVSIA